MSTAASHDSVRADILLRVQDIAREILDDPEIVLVDGGVVESIPDWDSVAHVQIMVAIEHRFDIQFSVDELSSFADIGELIDTIKSKRSVAREK